MSPCWNSRGTKTRQPACPLRLRVLRGSGIAGRVSHLLLGLWIVGSAQVASTAEVPDIIALDSLGSRGLTYEGTIPTALASKTPERLAPAGDVNGDGASDFLLTSSVARLASGHEGPVVFLVLGGSTSPPSIPLDGTGDGVVTFKTRDPWDLSSAAVAPAGDVNGDGLDDFLISTPEVAYFDAPSAGRVYLVLGARGLAGELFLDEDFGSAPLQGLIFYASTAHTSLGGSGHHGQAVAAIGDVNADGHGDFALGAPFAWDPEEIGPTGRISAGRMHILLWHPDLLSTGEFEVERIGLDVPGFVLDGEQPALDPINGGIHVLGDAAGYAIAPAGDVNGDAIDDFLVGAPGYPRRDVPESGLVYLIFGAAAFPPRLALADLDARGVRIAGPPPVDDITGLGTQVAGAGDFNGDGLADLLLGMPGDCCKLSHATSPGKVYVLFGRVTFPLDVDLEAEPENAVLSLGEASPGDRAGYAVAPAGDLNADGHSDILIGAYLAERDKLPLLGEGYVVFGSPELKGRRSLSELPDRLPGILVKGRFSYDTLGWAVAPLGDVNADGLPDFGIGAPRGTGDPQILRARPGRLYVILGTAGQLPLELRRADPAFGSVEGGYEVALLGSGFSADTAVFFDGRPGSTRSVTPSELKVAVPAGVRPGHVAIEARRGAERVRLEAGFEYTRRIPIPALTAPAPGVTVLKGNEEIGWVAYALAAGDLNADGFSDAVVASTPLSGLGWVVAGLFGRPLPPLTVRHDDLAGAEGFLIRGDPAVRPNDNLFVAVPGDINGDGIADLAIATGAPACYLVFGRSGLSLPSTLDEALAGGQAVRITHSGLGAAAAEAGFRVSGIPDLNQDGIAELAIGVPFDGATGAIYFVAGRSEWPPMFDLADEPSGVRRVRGPLYSLRYGNLLSSAGDVNGDGLGDLVVATYNPPLDASWAYLIYGTSSFEGNASVETLLETSRAVEFELTDGFRNFKYSTVSGAGDFNGDGFADLLIGVEGAGESFSGEVYLVFGGSALPAHLKLPQDLGAVGVLLSGEYPYDQTSTVTALGDFDRDGFDDIAAGAPGVHEVHAGGTPGKAFVVFGAQDFPKQLSLGRMASHGFKLNGTINFGGAGYRLSTAGDFNGDGAPDLLLGERGFVGAPGNAFVVLSPFTAKPFRRGDANFDGDVNISDAIFILSFLFLGGPGSVCDDAADADDSGALDITDAVRILNSLFLGNASLPEPYPEPGDDPTPDGLGCLGF